MMAQAGTRKGGSMATGMLVQIPGMGSDVYDSVMGHLGWDEKPLPQGFVSHYAGSTPDGWVVFDIWESQQDFERFYEERLKHALAAATGGQAPPMEPTYVQIHREAHAGA